MARRACSRTDGGDTRSGAGEGAPAGEGRRIDKWLWYARVVKTRTLAAALVEAGRVRLNRIKVDKSRQIVKPGDVLTVTVNRHVRVLKVVLPGQRRGPASEAQSLYEDLTPVDVAAPAACGAGEREDGPAVALQSGQRDAGASRPTKRERRQIDRLRGREA